MLEKEFLSIIGWHLTCSGALLQHYYTSLVGSHPSYELEQMSKSDSAGDSGGTLGHETFQETHSLLAGLADDTQASTGALAEIRSVATYIQRPRHRV